MAAQVHVSHPSDGVAQLLLDNGPRNFSTAPLHERLEEVLTGVREAGSRVVVLGSAVEGYFVSHGHIGDIVGNLTGSSPPSGDPRSFLRVQKELDTGPMVSIAAMDGQAWGGGFLLALSCDFRVASERTTICQPEILAGVCTAGEAARIIHLVGESAAKRLLLDGRPIDATEAHRLGLVDRVVPAGTALDEAVEWATWMAGRRPGDLTMDKDLIVGSRGLPLQEALRRETGMFVSRFSDEETVERLLEVQRRYDAGSDSYEAFGIPSPPM
ncbi:MAG TPA: enoyl-CoA hydratase/isomerase family protein [Acidimicrobiia bacterium]|nr:enoyl-CoA hydratase/isomerase family protein [Acidimicrobiia bacterium]